MNTSGAKRAMVIATGWRPALAHLAASRHIGLFPLLDRPFLRHVIEALVDLGVRRIDMVLSHLPEQVEHEFGDGGRWGCAIRYHLARDPASPYERLSALDPDHDDEPIWVVMGDTLPGPFHDPTGDADASASLLITEGERGHWTGWGRFNASQVRQLARCRTEHEFIQQADFPGGSTVVAQPGYRFQSYRGILDAQSRALDDARLTGELPSADDDGVRISPRAQVSPTATLTGPLFVADQVRIAPGVTLGPNVVCSENAVVDADCVLRDSLITAGSYVGEGLTLDGAIVDGPRLADTRLGTTLTVDDDLIMSALTEGGSGDGARATLSRITALLILLVAFPLLAATAVVLFLFRAGPVRYRHTMVIQPTHDDPTTWREAPISTFLSDADRSRPMSGLRHLLTVFLPGLPAVVAGRIRLVGIRPRTRDELTELSMDWRGIILKSKAGLISEDLINAGTAPDTDTRQTSETWYAAQAGWAHDISLMVSYLKCILTGFPNKR